ncbi:hypothetical protein AGMMS49938_03340 [Fibrobacterales bacterium]|nr:hypothetical protein AGMMS49938_03340 [Fibrobacterales bacterium]
MTHLSNNASYLRDGLTVSSPEKGLAIVSFDGALDIPSIVPFKTAIEDCVEKENTFIVVDLGNVNFVDSPFVGTLMSSRRVLRMRGGDLALSSASQTLQSRLSIMGIDRIFHFYANPQAAILDFHFLGSREQISFSLPLQREFTTLIRRFVSSILTTKGFKPKLIFHVETIIDELSNNAVDYSDVRSDNFFVNLSISRKKIVIVVKNSHGRITESEMTRLSEKYRNPTIDNESIRGRGIPLVKMLSNSVNLDISQTEIIVQVTKIVEV